jgi:hypothetical protein
MHCLQKNLCLLAPQILSPFMLSFPCIDTSSAVLTLFVSSSILSSKVQPSLTPKPYDLESDLALLLLIIMCLSFRVPIRQT